MAEIKRGTGWVVYYDGECGFCTLSVRALALADFFRVVTWTSYQELDEPPSGLAWEDLDAAAYLEVRKGSSQSGDGPEEERRLYQGFYAFRMLTLRLPPLMPLAPLLWLPGVNRLGESTYKWVAANRYRISRSCRLKAGR
ncbi:MAG: DCC1-like thiol-disulfide oxidoreductase family protein [Chloroflexota bacterium]|nr:DCC1-like thiol-disulfide oxidoreductase family protein [Chloroflexota bacterium]